MRTENLPIASELNNAINDLKRFKHCQIDKPNTLRVIAGQTVELRVEGCTDFTKSAVNTIIAEAVNKACDLIRADLTHQVELLD